MSYWEITPHASPDYDCCVLPAEDENDRGIALEYAQARMAEAWDSCEVGGRGWTVQIQLCDGDIPEVEE